MIEVEQSNRRLYFKVNPLGAVIDCAHKGLKEVVKDVSYAQWKSRLQVNRSQQQSGISGLRL